MTLELSKVELDITKELVNIGLAKAADSLSFFVKSKVMLNGLDLYISELNDIDQLSQRKKNDTHLLTTQLRGEVGGVCFFLLDEDDVNRLKAESFPKDQSFTTADGEKMLNAFLKEVDNIITASVITQFSNLLEKKIYGDVPTYKFCEYSNLDAELRSSISIDSCLLYFKVNFVTKNSELNPEFIWALDKEFIHGVQAFAQQKKSLC